MQTNTPRELYAETTSVRCSQARGAPIPKEGALYSPKCDRKCPMKDCHVAALGLLGRFSMNSKQAKAPETPTSLGNTPYGSRLDPCRKSPLN
ncbi:hypothetical protein NDU88_005457 [Pleurodeles waltl]|uniref:Uncharacterized protein n=1 Tax=Pleurodeles waltl TaxID=8319 RepID=A0AAV7TU05_PLEWA|nr:hypothetical protein NDU88_005457 [Pleurodeles waltl]